MNLIPLAQSIASDLGERYHLEQNYQFVVPQKKSLKEITADAVIFSSRIPSFQTAAVGFISNYQEQNAIYNSFSQYAYLGAPVIITINDSNVSVYEFRGTPLGEKIDEQSLADISSNRWLREKLLSKIESTQLNLSFDSGKTLLLQDTRDALSQNIKSLMERIFQDKQVEENECFKLAIEIVRNVIFGSVSEQNIDAETLKYVEDIANEVKQHISFANIPPEAIAELYENFAVGEESRRRKGIVYTPSWLAKYVINRLPSEAFRSGKAIDPTCGSGTFLVCFLEKLVEEKNKRKESISSDILAESIVGADNDPVAIEASRLSLDYFCKTIKIIPPKWELIVGDATNLTITGDWLVGNLPFGYRTFEGKRDISSVIIEKIEVENSINRGISIILPDSFRYTGSASKARELIRKNYNLQEIILLPESTFNTSTANTIVLVGKKGSPSSDVVVREVANQDIKSFKSGIYTSKNYVSKLSEKYDESWNFSPFSNEFEIANKYGIPLEQIANVHTGLQIYGVESDLFNIQFKKGTKPLLTSPKDFANWTEQSIKKISRFLAEKEQVRRPGPWELFDNSKIILRATTVPNKRDRLAAIADNQKVWFTDKFIGVWIHNFNKVSLTDNSEINIKALAAYFQTRFASAWINTYNPSRKLRNASLKKIPVPKLPSSWWERASELVKINYVTFPSEEYKSFSALDKEWEWFNSIVEVSLGIEPQAGKRLAQWFSNYESTSAQTNLPY
jgi:hypothetical protein